MATRQITIPAEEWTLVTIVSGCFQANCDMQVAESVNIPTDWSDPKKVIHKFKMYEYYRNGLEGLWGLSAAEAIITVDDEVVI